MIYKIYKFNEILQKKFYSVIGDSNEPQLLWQDHYCKQDACIPDNRMPVSLTTGKTTFSIWKYPKIINYILLLSPWPHIIQSNKN